jgi:hypothetical protein
MTKKYLNLQIHNIVVEGILSLGKTSAEIAESLMSKGMKGQKEDEYACPLVNYIQYLLKAFKLVVIVKKYYIFIEDLEGNLVLDIDTPEAIANFIEDLDEKKKYQELIIRK